MLTRLRQICCDPRLVSGDYTGGSAKPEQCMELLESCTGADIVIHYAPLWNVSAQIGLPTGSTG